MVEQLFDQPNLFGPEAWAVALLHNFFNSNDVAHLFELPCSQLVSVLTTPSNKQD